MDDLLSKNLSSSLCAYYRHGSFWIWSKSLLVAFFYWHCPARQDSLIWTDEWPSLTNTYIHKLDGLLSVLRTHTWFRFKTNRLKFLVYNKTKICRCLVFILEKMVDVNPLTGFFSFCSSAFHLLQYREKNKRLTKYQQGRRQNENATVQKNEIK